MNSRKELRVRVTVRNNFILSMMKDRGFESVSKLAQAAGVSPTVLGTFVNMTASPIDRRGIWRKSVLKLVEFFGCLPEDLFSGEHLMSVLKSNRSETEMSFADVHYLMATERAEALSPENVVFGKERSMAMANVFKELNAREEKIVKMRFGFEGGEPATLEEVAETLGVTRECIRQREQRAIKKLRHHSRRKFFDGLLP